MLQGLVPCSMYMRAVIAKGHLAQNLGRKVLFSTLLLLKSKTEIVKMSVTMGYIYNKAINNVKLTTIAT